MDTTKNRGVIDQKKIFLWIALATGLILLIPLIAMQLTNEVVWGLGDFVVMGTLLFGMGSLFVLTVRKVNRKYWALIGGAFALAFLYIWAELAVGVFTNLES